MNLKRRLTRIHLWIGEALGLTHYRNCHYCRHCDKSSEPALVWCDLYLQDHGCLAATDPCEAVWCDDFEDVGTANYQPSKVEDLLFSYAQACICASNEASTDAAKQTMLANLRAGYAKRLLLADDAAGPNELALAYHVGYDDALAKRKPDASKVAQR